MSEQSPSSKPKPGSLRDRIAAFEKSATAPVSAGQAPPPPRPRTAGLASWKPKVPSPPSSPSSKTTDHATSSSSGTMSASDAKESITRGGGGSLKERMAALQGKGAFGAPSPPLAPKPAVEKPRWKPPPAVASIDDENAGDEPLATAIAATLDRTKSPPISRKSIDLSKPITEGEEASVVEPSTSTGDDIEGVNDPEEEERQRRAAIAARMARLGGARLGMPPPMVGKKPPMPIRKPTREDVSKQEDREEVSKPQSITLERNISSPPNTNQGATDSPHAQDVEFSPVRKNSENASLLSVDSAESRSPPSMPVPTVPRRAGPPRKKPVKPPPEVPEEPPIAPAISTVDEVEHKAVEKAEETAIPTPELEGLDHRAEIHDEPQSIDSNFQHKPAEELITESKPAGPGEQTEQGPLHDEHEHEHEPVDPNHPHQPDVDTVRKDQVEDDEIIDHPDEHSDYDEDSAEQNDHQHLQQDNDHHVVAEPQPSSAVGVTGTEEKEEDDGEAEARRKRVAERLAKMGGINPFAASLSSPPLRSTSGHADSPVVSGHALPASVALPVSPTRPDIPPRNTSLPSYEVAEPHLLAVVEPKVEEEREISDEIDDKDTDVDPEEGSSDKTRILEAPMEESSLAAYDLSPPPPRQIETAPVRQLPDPILRPPVPRPHLQIQQYGRHDTGEEHSTTRPSTVPDPLVSHEEPHLSSARPAQPPRRIVPQAPEEEEAEEEAGTDDEVAPSHVFVRSSVQERGSGDRGRRRFETSDDDGSENDTPALPVLQRRSEEVLHQRSIPPAAAPPAAPPSHPHLAYHLPTSSSNVYEPDSDHDGQALPVRPPRRIPVSPALTSPTSVLPRPTPRRSVPSAPENEESLYGMPAVAVSKLGEILDDEEGDPIDPAFHCPSRQPSMGNIRASAQDNTLGLPVQVLVNVEKREEVQQQQQQEQDQTRPQTLAERMAKLGGIKFGAVPIPAAVSRLPPPPEEEGSNHPQADGEHVEQPVALSEEEEERARKERIATKLAGMGGMRIGMMPMGMGPQRTHVLRDEVVAPSSPTRAVPLASPPLPPTLSQTRDPDSERPSDDGVRVEAEESGKVEYTGAADAFEETPPPPVPSRGGRRRESTDKAISPPPPTIPGSRPPVPAGLPTRRASARTSRSIGSGEFKFSSTQSTSSHILPQSEYVIVDEPHGHEEGITSSRRSSRITSVQPPPRTRTSDPHSISSQWEIPTTALDFGGGTDLSLSSWTGEPTSPPVVSPSPPAPPKQPTVPSHKRRPSELQLSADDLMTTWGRVGVQVCEVATSLFENSKKTLIGDGTYAGFVSAVLAGVPNAAPISVASGEYGYLVYAQNGTSVQRRVSEVMPGDIVEINEGKLKGHKGIQMYHQNVGGSGEALLGIVGEFEAKKSKIRVFHANQHVGQQTVESVSYRLEDLKSGTVKVYRVLEQ